MWRTGTKDPVWESGSGEDQDKAAGLRNAPAAEKLTILNRRNMKKPDLRKFDLRNWQFEYMNLSKSVICNKCLLE